MKSLLIIALLASVPNLSFAQKVESKEGPAVTKKQASKKNKMEIKPAVSFRPTNFILTAAPGTTVNEKLIVQNNENVEFKAQVVVVPIYANDSGALFREEEVKSNKKMKASPLPFLKDIIIPEKIVSIKPKQLTTVPISFKIPEDAKGSFYFQYSVQPIVSEYTKIKKSKNKDLKSAGVMMTVNVYSLGAISVKDKSQVDIVSKTQIKYLKPTKQVLIQSQLTNQGNDFVRKYEGIGVISKEGKVVAKFELKGTQNLTMLTPKATQTFAGSVGAELEKGDYDVVLTFQDFKGEKMTTFKEKLKVN